MPIPEEFLLRLRETIDIVETVAPYVQLKKASRDYVCLCPFHSEKTPSCHIYTESNSFYCFGCGAGGDNITFIRMAENLDYIEAIRFLAAKAGLRVPEEGVSDRELEGRVKIFEINRKAAVFFRDTLLSSAIARDYLHKRGLSDNIIKKFGLGYAADSWNAIKGYLFNQGYSEDELLEASLITRGAGNNTYDKFRNRIMFPIIDRRGNVVGFGGRALNSDDNPKYLNSSETPVFHKRSNLFAINFAKNTKEKHIILCEGNMDVIALYQAGFDNAVATLGTAITSEQARVLQNYCEKVVIAYDSDEAGQKATVKAINLLSAVGLSARVLEMRGAKDPDEYLLKYGRESFLELINKSGSAISFELKKVRNSVNIETPEGRSEYLKKAVSLLADVSSPIDRMVYISEVSKATDISVSNIELSVAGRIKQKRRTEEKTMRKKLIREAGGANAKDKIDLEESSFKSESNAERGIIAFLLHSPDFLPLILKHITPDYFPTSFNRTLFETLIIKIKNFQSIDISSLGSEFSTGEMGRIEKIKRELMILNPTKELLLEYIDTLKKHKEVKNQKSPGSMSADELLRYTEKLGQKLRNIVN
ncbi:MAG: DNA primase [Eubacterium sp.]|nr:DNA primase [Eubacterium sp.]